MKSNKEPIITLSVRIIGFFIIIATILLSLSSCTAVLESLSYVGSSEEDEFIEGEYSEEVMEFVKRNRFKKTTKEPEKDVFSTYGISDDGKIALGYPRDAFWELFYPRYIVVYSPNNEFLYGIELHDMGNFSLWWDGDILCVYFRHAASVISFDENCNIVGIDEFEDSTENKAFLEYVSSHTKMVGNTQYRASFLGGYYSLLISQKDGTETILHDATDQFILESGLGAGCFIMFFLIAGLIIYLKSRK